ncbi:MAG: Rpn family recombination-promoting nuclease/putative transposase [Lachnospiraceae bacterium]|nr:Rpn family recombination-promoting nuclease/putative transposase [Lachnospiraceae bacterium]
MGKKDDYQFDYLDDNVRFADQINGALFNGKQVVKPEELEPEDSQNVSIGSMDETGKKRQRSIRTVVDKARIWRGRKLHILVVENQNYVDYQMVLRNMLSESIGYRKQWKLKKHIHTNAKDLKNRDEYLSGINKEEKFSPIITLVVFFGTDHPWDGARCLHDLLDIDDELKEYVTNYRLNLYDCQEHDTFNEYRTGLKLVFETVRYSKDKEKLKEIIEENQEEYSRIDSDTKDMLEIVANVEIPEKFKIVEDGEEKYDMCKAFEDMRQEGRNEERKEGIRILIQTCHELGLSNEIIIQKCTEKYEITGENARKYVQKYCV